MYFQDKKKCGKDFGEDMPSQQEICKTVSCGIEPVIEWLRLIWLDVGIEPQGQYWLPTTLQTYLDSRSNAALVQNIILL